MSISMFFPGLRPAQPKLLNLICTVAIDSEEDFDWNDPDANSYSTEHMRNIVLLRDIFSCYGIVPAYLLTYPILKDRDAVRLIRRQLDRGECIAGIQLHPWVTPPFDDGASRRASFGGNLEPSLEERKLLALKTGFAEAFGFEPTVFRAGRYGLSRSTAALLEKHNLEIDTSLAPRSDFASEGGPDYSNCEYAVFWFGLHRNLLEIPLCRSIVGWAGTSAATVYRHLSAPRLAALHLPAVLSRLRCAERITLSPEGNDLMAIRRLIHGLRAREQRIFTLSFHSSSIGVGRNPYVRSKADLHRFYDRLSAILDYLAATPAFRFAPIQEIPSLLMPPSAVSQP